MMVSMGVLAVAMQVPLLGLCMVISGLGAMGVALFNTLHFTRHPFKSGMALAHAATFP
jgi:hypothetical protein